MGARRHPQSSWRRRVNPPRQRGTAAIPACHNHSGPSQLRPSHWKPVLCREEQDTGWSRRDKGYKGKDLHVWLYFLCHPEDSGGVVGFMVSPERMGDYIILLVLSFCLFYVIHLMVMWSLYFLLCVLSEIFNSSGMVLIYATALSDSNNTLYTALSN